MCIGTKLRNLLLKTGSNSNKLPFGKDHFTQVDHLKILLEKFSKDKHQLTASTFDSNDKQNFDSMLRIIDERVLNLLKQHVPKSEATIKFLEIIRNVIEAYTDKDLSPLDRIGKIWDATFLIRIWRHFISSKTDATLKDNFLSRNSYSCIEINAHSMVLLLLYLKKNDMPEYFLPFLFHSQACEGFFRQIRSFTSTYSTVANCSVKEIIGRINRIQLQRDISFRSDFKYPRASSSVLKIGNEFELPTETQIIECIERSKKSAIASAVEIGLESKRALSKFDISCHIPPIEMKINVIRKQETETESVFQIKPKKSIDLKNFSSLFKDRVVPQDSPYVEIADQKLNRCIVKKTSFCWLLRSDSAKLSSDRLIRVQAATGPLTMKKSKNTINRSKSAKKTSLRKAHEEQNISPWITFEVFYLDIFSLISHSFNFSIKCNIYIKIFFF